MVSFKVLLVSALLPLASAFIAPQSNSRAVSYQQQLHVVMPIDPFGPMVPPAEEKKEQVVEKKQQQEEELTAESMLSTVMTVNGVLLGLLVLMATLAPSPAVDQLPTTTAAVQRERTVEAKNHKLYEENLGADQVTYMDADFGFFF